MISVHQAREEIARRITPLSHELVPLGRAHGRTLQEPVTAPDDMPAFDRSAMDGYTIRQDDLSPDLTVVGEIRAGDVVDKKLSIGETFRIFTGARLPGAQLNVIPQENVESTGPQIRIVNRPPVSHVRARGEEARAGDVLLPSGLSLDATALALLAAVGKTSVAVSRLPRVLHLTTGDEIVPPEAKPGPGQIRNSNASLIAGLCCEQGIAAIDHLHVCDNLKAMTTILDEVHATTYDLVLISGGSGQGAYDFSAELFRHLGVEIHFRQVDVRPGKPLIFGTAPGRVVFGLPGNALSHFVCFHLFVRQALNHLLGRPTNSPTQGVVAETLSGTSNSRETWWPAHVKLHEGRLECRALPWKSSGDITRLPSAQALIQVPASTPSLNAGTMVPLLLTRPLF